MVVDSFRTNFLFLAVAFNEEAMSLRHEFSNRSNVSAAIIALPMLNWKFFYSIEHSVFESLGIKSMGHKLMLSRALWLSVPFTDALLKIKYIKHFVFL